jgi:hypothetical protein
VTTPAAHKSFCIAFSGFVSRRVKEWIGRTYQNCNRLRRVTVPFSSKAIFSIGWHLHAALRHSNNWLRTARQFSTMKEFKMNPLMNSSRIPN